MRRTPGTTLSPRSRLTLDGGRSPLVEGRTVYHPQVLTIYSLVQGKGSEEGKVSTDRSVSVESHLIKFLNGREILYTEISSLV